ncbi:DUF1972 domain-containing protein [Lacisediminihabitans sp. H27-G8]|uniref:DUF1972 domain-containing protein n=1 Tax=Lacisediminihabitans sp. H27-G8 TaxID=3111909 RepID=UPI0038FCC48D
MIGTRGVPAAYGGFETAVEEIGARLVERGHMVTVYCRGSDQRVPFHRGMKLVHLPALHLRAAETLSHSALSVIHASVTTRPDAAFVFNAANAPFLPILRARRIPTAVHVDGLEWMRDKWSGAGRRYYLGVERLAVKLADALIADAPGIASYYSRKFQAETELISYGTRIVRNPPSERLAELGLEPGKFHLVVARFEPENHVDLIVEGFSESRAHYPLIVVGSAPYAAAYTRRVQEIADADSRIRVLGGIWDQELLDQLYTNALTYAHGHSVGGTNPSLLRAMGGATPVLAYDVEFNRDVLGEDGLFFRSAAALREQIDHAEHHAPQLEKIGQRLQRRAEQKYDWDDVASEYEALARRLTQGASIHTRRRHSEITASGDSNRTIPTPAPTDSRIS